jgi:cobalamin-dependent methionine synthase I
VPLALQREIFAALKCERHLGLTLRENCLMSPARSVTALVGLRSPEGGNPA